MIAPKYAPEFRVTVGGKALPAALRGSVTSVTSQTGLEGHDRVELTLANPDLRWLDDPLLAIDRPLALELGYAPGPLAQVFAGEIVGHTATFPAGGMPTLNVTAQDRLRHLEDGVKARWFAIPTGVGNIPIPDPAVAAIVSAENGLVPVLDPVGAVLSVLLAGASVVAAGGDMQALQKILRKQDGESDYDFLARIAKENGWEMHIDHAEPLGGHKLHFFASLGHLSSDATFTYGHDLIDFTPRLSTVGQVAAVTVHVWIPAIKTSFAVTAGWDWDRASLTVDVKPAIAFMAKGPSSIHIEDPVTLASAPRTILSELIPRLNQRLTGSASILGDETLRPGDVVSLRGLGVQFGGLYRVTSVNHTLDGGGFRTSFDVRKEIWFGSIPLPSQGAVPIRLEGAMT